MVVKNSILFLYEAVAQKLPKTYTNIRWGDLEEEEEGAVGIYDIQAADDTETIDGEIQYKTVKFDIRVNARRGINGYSEAIDYLNEFIESIEKTPCNISGLTFISVRHLGQGASRDYRNQFGIVVCRASIEIKYIFGDN